MLDALIPQEDADASKELAKQFGRRGITLHLGKQCTKVEDSGSELTVHFGDGETVQADLMLVSVGRGAARRGARARGRSASSSTGARASPPTSTAARPSRTSTRSATAPATGSSRTRPSARARSPRRTRWVTTRSSTTAASRGRSTPIRRSRGVGLTEAEAREQHGDDVAVGTFPWIANARAVMQNETVGWVKSIHETRYGELLGIVMVGPHVTDLIEAGVVALDAESTVETVADGMAAHPTLSRPSRRPGWSRSAGRFMCRRSGKPQPGPSETEGAAMGIVNRRNAMLGWAVWQVGKRVAEQKAKSCRARPCRTARSRRLSKAALIAGVAAVGGRWCSGGRRAPTTSSRPCERRAILPPLDRRARPVRAGKADRGGAARARPRPRRQARVERGDVRAVPGGARGARAAGARAEPLPRRRCATRFAPRSPSATASRFEQVADRVGRRRRHRLPEPGGAR